jgi:hypothetical protein
MTTILRLLFAMLALAAAHPAGRRAIRRSPGTFVAGEATRFAKLIKARGITAN